MSSNASVTSEGSYTRRQRGNGNARTAKVDAVMTRNRQVRALQPVDDEDSVTVTISIVGVKFRCLVVKEWPCESLVATAIAEYHLAFPTCEMPDCNLIFHSGRKEYIPMTDLIAQWCDEGDEIELGMTDRFRTEQRPAEEQFETYDFTIIFHRLPLGFTLKQEDETTVVANIYPRSAATHYDRLVPGVAVVKIGEFPLEFLGLRQVHEVIKNAKIPVHIHFRGWKKPITRVPRMPGEPIQADASSDRPRRKSVKADDPASAAASAGIPALFDSAADLSQPGSHSPSPYSQTKQRLTSERKKTNASSPYMDRQSIAAARRGRGGPDSRSSLSVPLVDQLENLSNQGNTSDDLHSTSSMKLKQRDFRMNGTPLKSVDVCSNASNDPAADGLDDRLSSTHISEVDSNQNDESEEMLMEHIKILKAELIKKHEEIRMLTGQVEKCESRLSRMQEKRTGRNGLVSNGEKKGSSLNLRLTPEALEAIDTKAGLPPKGTGQYTGSNASSVSNYSNRSAMAKRHAHLARVVGKTGLESARSDASVSSCNSNSSERRRRSAQNLGSRYNYMPPKYSATTQYYDAPSSFSTKGAVMPRAKFSRDSFITISESPGVGAYDVKVPERVRGGEIGDSDRSLPWP
ncbi:hypothetical protein Poli38472_013857 [Pythium oligandrum]|uniref:PDZ domain-containing protein n=1 Tax=Pythium oligandrum TaxID=41045 RepID=A0A8K1F9D2_PYTOL|nr:hypothetical protein Poli38472_013857 [Pythium oligandrum]|eukprot:TMW55095.1 hypothetical protein Poli38472_013857 [Pythium oligandrum]